MRSPPSRLRQRLLLRQRSNPHDNRKGRLNAGLFAFPGCSASGQDNYNHPGKREKHGVDKVTFSSTRTLR
jgi:hypothetical protein